jgi:hypothetical protein
MADRQTGLSLRALLLYGALAIAIVDHGASITHNLSGAGADPFAFVWFIGWWPYAVAHHLDPLFTWMVWRPVGVPITWVTSVPFLAAILSPVTILGGAPLAYNVAVIAAPAVSAWAAYRLCKWLAGQEVAALIGGYLYGFSTYVLQQDTGALNLSFVPAPSLLLLVVLQRLSGGGRRGFVLGFTLLLIVQFLICIEIAANCLLFGAIAWALAMLYLPQYRPALRRLVTDLALAGLCFLLVMSPLLWQMAKTMGGIHLNDLWRYYFSADLLNIFLPSQQNLWGWLGRSPLAAHGGQEADAYLGVPWLLLIAGFAFSARRLPVARYLILLFALMLLACLGPLLWVDGIDTNITLPWIAISHLPLIGEALPARFAMFAALAGALIVALFLARAGQPWRHALALLACLAILPRPHPWMALPNEPFFAPGAVQAALGPAPQLLIVPFALNGPSSYWQVQSGFAFTQTGGYLGYPPAAMQHYPAVGELFGNTVKPGFAADVATFAQATGTQFVVIAPGAKPEMAAALAGLGWPARHIDDVTILTVPHG